MVNFFGPSHVETLGSLDGVESSSPWSSKPVQISNNSTTVSNPGLLTEVDYDKSTNTEWSDLVFDVRML